MTAVDKGRFSSTPFLRLSVSRTRRLQERRRSRMETTRLERRDTFLTRGCP